MNIVLADKLLSSVMEWTPQESAEIFPRVLFMSDMKYDSYDQFMPGNRFMASFTQWLNQFDPTERKTMFDMVMDKLIFISSTQMSYLVDLLYNSKIKSCLISKAADELGIQPYLCSKILKLPYFEEIKRKSLVLGLSDGAHTDILRRSAGFSNEQILTLYYPSDDKVKEMLCELQKCYGQKSKFVSLFLIDDFTASGTSFIRKDAENNYKGKLTKILSQFCDVEGHNVPIKELMVDDRVIDVHICFCIATEYARNYIENTVHEYLEIKGLMEKLRVTIEVVQMLSNSVSIDREEDAKLYNIIKNPKYFDDDILKKTSYRVGLHTEPYLGFNEGALPLVLSHNTPNNSLPIIWQDSIKIKGLFPRISRH